MKKIIFHLAALISLSAMATTAISRTSEINSSVFRVLHISSGKSKETMRMPNEKALSNDAISIRGNLNGNSENHIVKFRGIPDADGRYIKYSYSLRNSSETICASSNIQFYFYTNYLGVVTGQYYICADVLGTQCEPVSTDTYTVTTQGNDIVANPQEYTVDLSKVSAKYPSCTDD